MPYYDQQAAPQPGGARDRITQALLAIQNPPPVTPMPPPQPMPAMPGAQGMTQAATGTPGVSSPMGNSMIASMTQPQLPGGNMTSTLGQQQQAAAPSPTPSLASSPMPTQQQPGY